MSFEQASNEKEPLLRSGRRSGLDPEDLQNATQQISSLVNSISQFEKNLKNYGTIKDTPSFRHQIQISQQKITETIKNNSNWFRNNTPVTPQERTAYQKLLTTFQDLVKQFQKLSEDYQKKERTFAPVADVPISESPQPKIGGLSELDLKLKEYDPTEHDAAIVTERNQNIKQVTEDLLTLHEIFADVSKMVGEQGEELEQVELNMAEADLAVAQATAELQEAGYYNREATKKKIFLYIFCAICWLVIFAIIAGVLYKVLK